jgi:hypothetical protein
MGVSITSKLLDQIGLLLGFISGIPLIPEVFRLLPIEKLEEAIEKLLLKIESASLVARRIYPFFSYKTIWIGSEEEVEKHERSNLIIALIFPILWILLLVFMPRIFTTIWFSFVLIATLYIVGLGGKRKFRSLGTRVSRSSRLVLYMSFFPLMMLLWAILVIFRFLVRRIRRYFSTKDVVRTSLTIIAIIMFILSNIFQFIATLI